MRVLHIDTGRELRGGQRQALMLMRGLREAGHASELLARSASPLWEAAAALGFAVYPATLKSLWRRSRDADLVHAHDARAHTLAALASRQLFVVSRRVAFPLQGGSLSRWKYRRAQCYLAVSQFVRAEMERGGVPAAKITVVYDGVEVQPLAGGIEETSFQAVAINSHDPQKGRRLIQQAAAIANVPVTFSADLTRDLPRASVFLYITESEGLGSAALLAMSLKVPVVASRVGGLPEVVEDGDSGFLVANDPAAIAESILRLRAEPALARALGHNGRLRVEQKFTMPHMVKSTLKAYRRVLPA